MKKFFVLALAALLMTGCSVNEDITINSNGSVTVSVMSAIPVNEAFDGMKVDQKDVKELEKKTIDGVECYVSEETQTVDSIEEFNKEYFGSSQAGELSKNYVYFGGDTSSTNEGYDFGAFKVSLKFTFPEKIAFTNGKKLGDNTVEFDYNNIATGLCYASTESYSEVSSDAEAADTFNKKVEEKITEASPAVANKTSYTVKKGKKVIGKITQNGKPVKIIGKGLVFASDKKIVKVVKVNKGKKGRFVLKGLKKGTATVYFSTKERESNDVAVSVTVK